MQFEKRHQIESNFPCEHTTSCAQRQPYLPGFKGGIRQWRLRHRQAQFRIKTCHVLPARDPSSESVIGQSDDEILP
jgi:hypothetical protein